jgi:hypothetical protein
MIKCLDALQNSLDSLCFDALVPKNVMQRYVSLLIDYKSLLFCGPQGANKSLMARKIAEHLVKRQNKDVEVDVDTSIAFFDVENKSSKELKLYLNSLVEMQQHSYVLILENLDHVTNLADAFAQYFLNSKNNTGTKWYVGSICYYLFATNRYL